MSTDDSEEGKLVIDLEEDLIEEDLLGESHCSDLDDSLSVGDLDDWLDSDSLFDDVSSSKNKQLSQKSSSVSVSKCTKPSKVTPVTAPKTSPTVPLTSSRIRLVNNAAAKATPTLTPKLPRIIPTSSTRGKDALGLPKQTCLLKRVGVPGGGVRNVKVKLSQKSPVEPPVPIRSCQTSFETAGSGGHLPQVSGYCEDFVFPSPHVASRFVGCSVKTENDVLPFSDFEEGVCPQQEESYNLYESDDVEHSTQSYSSSAQTSPFTATCKLSAGENNLRVVHVRENVQPPCGPVMTVDGPCDSDSCSVESTGGDENPFHSRSDDVLPGSQRMVVYNSMSQDQSERVSPQSDQTGARKKSTIIKLNQTKVFRYVPEELPDVECPTLAMRKKPLRKRTCAYRGRDCPDLLLESKRHVEDDLRSTLSAQRSGKLTLDEDSPMSESQKRAVRMVKFGSTSSPARLRQDSAQPTPAPSALRQGTSNTASLRDGGTWPEVRRSRETGELELPVESQISSPVYSKTTTFSSSFGVQNGGNSGCGLPGDPPSDAWQDQFTFKMSNVDPHPVDTWHGVIRSRETSVELEQPVEPRFSSSNSPLFSSSCDLQNVGNSGRGMSGDLRLDKQQQQFNFNFKMPISPTKDTCTAMDVVSNTSEMRLDAFSSDRSRLESFSFSPAKEPTVERRPMTQFPCVSIFARRPSLLSRTNGVGFTLRHLDGPQFKPFVLDHL